MIGRTDVREGTLSREFRIGGVLCGYGFIDITLNYNDLSILMELSDDHKLHWLNHIYTRLIPPHMERKSNEHIPIPRLARGSSQAK